MNRKEASKEALKKTNLVKYIYLQNAGRNKKITYKKETAHDTYTTKQPLQL